MKTCLKGIYKKLKLFVKKLVVKQEKEIEIGHPTNVLHEGHFGYDSSEGRPSWMEDYKRGPNFSKTFSTLGSHELALSDHNPEAETSSRSSQGTQLSAGAPKVPKKPKQKKIKSSQSKASKSKPNNEGEAIPVTQVENEIRESNFPE